MSTKISSLYAEISADVSGFEKEAKKVKQELSEQERALKEWSKQATLEAKSFASVEKQKQQALAKTAREAEKAAKDSIRAQQEANAQAMKFAGGAVIAFAAVSAAAIKAYDSYQKAADGVRALSQASGSTAEEASILIQVLDDFGVSGEDVITTSKAMKEKGLAPTLETLAGLADQFVKIQDPIEKTKFAQDNLGKSYIKYLDVLSQGGDVLRENATEVNKNLILTDAQIKQAERARLAVDEVTDAWEGYKVQIGSAIGEVIIAQNEHEKVISILKEQGVAMGRGVENTEAYQDALAQLHREQETGGMDVYAYRLTKLAETFKQELVPAIESVQAANQNLISDAISQTEANENFAEAQQKTTDKIAEYQAKLAGLFPWETEKRDEIIAQIGEQQEKYAEDADKFAEASNKKLAIMTIEKIAMLDGQAGFSEAEQAKALAVAETLGVVEGAALRETIAFDAVSTAIANGTLKAQDMDAALSLMTKGYSIDVVLNTIANMANGKLASGGQSGYSQLAAGDGYAEGGWTGGASSNEVTGVVHGKEWVVPTEGGLVMREGNKSQDNSELVKLFQELINETHKNRVDIDKMGRVMVMANKTNG